MSTLNRYISNIANLKANVTVIPDYARVSEHESARHPAAATPQVQSNRRYVSVQMHSIYGTTRLTNVINLMTLYV